MTPKSKHKKSRPKSTWERKFGHSEITSGQYLGVCFLALCAMISLVAIAYSPAGGTIGLLGTAGLTLKKITP